MIDDRMTPLDPVEEFMSVCQQRETNALSPRPASHGVRVVEKGCSKSGAHRKSAVTPFPGCARNYHRSRQ
ncbi:hypothetical protein CHARACLAT_025233 [Characodon lateralis]|uniref:Uncharacterized protein n=1 Tax=Characodon lateralis TaxID=208331 RepID=A0ABU7CRT3_9TELE|nr:hypothetical protein [Characodon lateralis]